MIIKSDPYYLRVEVIIAGKDGVPYSSGPLEDGFTLPDWFVAHMCSIPVDDNRLTAQLWDSLEGEGVEFGQYRLYHAIHR